MRFKQTAFVADAAALGNKTPALPGKNRRFQRLARVVPASIRSESACRPTAGNRLPSKLNQSRTKASRRPPAARTLWVVFGNQLPEVLNGVVLRQRVKTTRSESAPEGKYWISETRHSVKHHVLLKCSKARRKQESVCTRTSPPPPRALSHLQVSDDAELLGLL